MILPQDDRLSLLVRQPQDGLLNVPGPFLFLQQLGRGVGVVRDIPLFIHRFVPIGEGQRKKPFGFAQFVDTAVARDGEEPSRKLRVRLITVAAPDEGDKYIVGGILGVGPVAQHPQTKVEYPILVAMEYHGDGLAISLLEIVHDVFVRLIHFAVIRSLLTSYEVFRRRAPVRCG